MSCVLEASIDSLAASADVKLHSDHPVGNLVAHLEKDGGSTQFSDNQRDAITLRSPD